MRVLITGMRGTVAPKVARIFRARGDDVISWDRDIVPPDDHDAGTRFMNREKPDAVCHLAMGSEEWAGMMARYAAALEIPFLFTSTAMVFDSVPDGPHRPGDRRTAKDDYGLYKIRCEDIVLKNNSGAIIVRFGWQIDDDASGNNMLAHLDRQQSQDGKIQAGRLWIPACSFMEDTALSMRTLILEGKPGVVHLDSNARAAWPFDRVARAVQKRFDRKAWKIEVTENYVHDQRLAGHEDRITGIEERLTASN